MRSPPGWVDANLVMSNTRWVLLSVPEGLVLRVEWMAHHAECGLLCLASSDLQMTLGAPVPAAWVVVLAGSASLVLDGGLHMVWFLGGVERSGQLGEDGRNHLLIGKVN